MTVAVVLALAPLTVRGRERRRRSSSRSLSSRERSRSSDRSALGACALVLGETGLDPRVDTALGVLTATDHGNSVRVPLLAGELVVTRSPSSSS